MFNEVDIRESDLEEVYQRTLLPRELVNEISFEVFEFVIKAVRSLKIDFWLNFILGFGRIQLKS